MMGWRFFEQKKNKNKIIHKKKVNLKSYSIKKIFNLFVRFKNEIKAKWAQIF